MRDKSMSGQVAQVIVCHLLTNYTIQIDNAPLVWTLEFGCTALLHPFSKAFDRFTPHRCLI